MFRIGKRKILAPCQVVQDLLNLSEFVNNGSTNNSTYLLRSMESFVQSYDILFFIHFTSAISQLDLPLISQEQTPYTNRS